MPRGPKISLELFDDWSQDIFPKDLLYNRQMLECAMGLLKETVKNNQSPKTLKLRNIFAREVDETVEGSLKEAEIVPREYQELIPFNASKVNFWIPKEKAQCKAPGA